jgi:hypothetical protein
LYEGNKRKRARGRGKSYESGDVQSGTNPSLPEEKIPKQKKKEEEEEKSIALVILTFFYTSSSSSFYSAHPLSGSDG